MGHLHGLEEAPVVPRPGAGSNRQFLHSRHGGTCPEPITIVYIFPGPAPSEELAVLPQESQPPHTPEPPTCAFGARQIIKTSYINAVYLVPLPPAWHVSDDCHPQKA